MGGPPALDLSTDVSPPLIQPHQTVIAWAMVSLCVHVCIVVCRCHGTHVKIFRSHFLHSIMRFHGFKLRLPTCLGGKGVCPWATFSDPGLEMFVDFFFFLICFFCSCLVLFVCFSFYIHLFIWVYICVGVSVDVRGLLIGIIGSFLLCGFQEPNSGQKGRWKHIESWAILLALRCFFVPLISAVNYFSWLTNNHSWAMSHQDLSCNKGSFNPTFSIPFQIFLFFSKSFSVLQLPYL